MFLRFILFVVLFYLVYKLIKELFSGGKTKTDEPTKKSSSERKVSKDVGEFVEYEDLDD